MTHRASFAPTGTARTAAYILQRVERLGKKARIRTSRTESTRRGALRIIVKDATTSDAGTPPSMVNMDFHSRTSTRAASSSPTKQMRMLSLKMARRRESGVESAKRRIMTGMRREASHEHI